MLRQELRREDYDRRWLKARPPAFATSSAEQCRRVGNDLYRAAQAAEKHEELEGVTFGAEGLGRAKEVMEKYHAAIEAYTKGAQVQP